MKQELTFAIVLLAIGGGFLYFNRNPAIDTNSVAISSDMQVTEAGDQATDVNDYGDSIALASFPNDSNGIQESADQVSNLASHQAKNEPAEPANTKSESANTTPGLASMAVSQSGFGIGKTDQRAVTLLAITAREIANSKPFKSSLSLRAETFGQNVSASGTYYQMGQGTHKTRIEMVFESMLSKPTLTQICDGRFFYTINSEDRTTGTNAKTLPQKTLEFVDLQRVQQAAGERPTPLTPTGWVATGGLSSLLQHLASGFNFGPPTQLPNSMVMIRGVWDPNALRQIIATPDGPALEGPIDWEQIPKQLPHAVEFVFSNNNGTYFPSQVSFFRFDNGTAQAVPTMILNLSNPSALNNLADGFFVIDSNNLKPTDRTDHYIARIQSFQQTQQAAKEATTLER